MCRTASASHAGHGTDSRSNTPLPQLRTLILTTVAEHLQGPRHFSPTRVSGAETVPKAACPNLNAFTRPSSPLERTNGCRMYRQDVRRFQTAFPANHQAEFCLPGRGRVKNCSQFHEHVSVNIPRDSTALFRCPLRMKPVGRGKLYGGALQSRTGNLLMLFSWHWGLHRRVGDFRDRQFTA